MSVVSFVDAEAAVAQRSSACPLRSRWLSPQILIRWLWGAVDRGLRWRWWRRRGWGTLEHVLPDNDREFCGRPLHHPYELFLA